jgi:hypothetical protein
MKADFLLPAIPEEQKTALVHQMLDLIEHQGAIIEHQAEQIQQLKDEIARLKNQPPSNSVIRGHNTVFQVCFRGLPGIPMFKSRPVTCSIV